MVTFSGGTSALSGGTVTGEISVEAAIFLDSSEIRTDGAGTLTVKYLAPSERLTLPHYLTAELPTTEVMGSVAFCSDGYSLMCDSGSTATGIVVIWNGNHWLDVTGNETQN
ncbi:hypothetical protein [Gluconobacter kondonii]|uniref:hypothetical protein n=1 Tax=Gluconobacter kondonii TaxID=941463 RepID=UPI001B8BCCA9|nr:hypothetical protein [Gluconobacter kondonii]MBS1055000.1 hypothetical protein [Gluconobacter kondonii]